MPMTPSGIWSTDRRRYPVSVIVWKLLFEVVELSHEFQVQRNLLP